MNSLERISQIPEFSSRCALIHYFLLLFRNEAGKNIAFSKFAVALCMHVTSSYLNIIAAFLSKAGWIKAVVVPSSFAELVMFRANVREDLSKLNHHSTKELIFRVTYDKIHRPFSLGVHLSLEPATVELGWAEWKARWRSIGLVSNTTPIWELTAWLWYLHQRIISVLQQIVLEIQKEKQCRKIKKR